MPEFPLYFAIRRYRPNIEDDYPELEPYKNLGVIIQSTKDSSGNWKLELLETPSILLENVRIIPSRDEWYSNRIVDMTAYKYKSKSTIAIRVKFNDIALVTPEFSIPLLKISDPCEVLSNKFFNITEHTSCAFDVSSNVPLVVKPTIPEHIMAVYIQSLLDKKEICPITMEPLQKESLYITSCGHAMSKAAATRWFAQKDSCPVCRAVKQKN
jgi:hypothetical protein